MDGMCHIKDRCLDRVRQTTNMNEDSLCEGLLPRRGRGKDGDAFITK